MLEDGDDDGDLFSLEREASEAENRGPRVDVPSVEDPSESLPDPSTVDPEVRRSFVTAVLYANVALLGVSLGAMLVAFRGQWDWGGFAIAVGLLAGVRVYQTYRAFEQWREERDAEEAAADSDDTETDSDEASGAETDTETDTEAGEETAPDDPPESRHNTTTEDD